RYRAADRVAPHHEKLRRILGTEGSTDPRTRRRASKMRIQLKSRAELELMRDAGLVAADILNQMCDAAKPGVSTWELDVIARKAIDKNKVVSAFLGYHGYPAVVCTSINSVVVHGIPRKSEVLADGDIIGIDFGIYKHGFCADTARTVLVGDVSEEK